MSRRDASSTRAAGTLAVPAAQSLLAFACALLVSCSAPPPRPDAGEPPDAGEVDAGLPRLDFSDPGQAFTLGPFEVEACGRWVVCAQHPTLGWGALGVERYDARTYDRFADVWDGGRPAFEALRDVVDDSRALVVSDRQAGCPAGTRVTLLPTREVVVGGQAGLAWGFDVFSAEGAVREKTRQYATLRGPELWFLNVGALDRELSCLEPIGEFTPEAFTVLEPYLDTLAAELTLPDGGW